MLVLSLVPYLLLICLLLGASIGCVSAYSVVRRWSLLGDIMSHASLPGIVYMFLLTHTKNVSLLLCGGVISALLSSFMSFYLQKKKLFAKDTPFAIVLSWFFSAGIIGLAVIQKKSIEGQSLLNNFIFGNILMCANQEMFRYVPILIAIVIIFIISYRVQEILGFDYEYALLRYAWIKYIDALMLFLSVIVIVIGLQAIGVLLMGALIIAPGLTARFLSNSYITILILSIIMSIIAFIMGVGLSIMMPYLPTGPLVSLISVVGAMLAAGSYWMRKKC